MFEGSLISENEMIDRGITFYPGVLQKFRKSKLKQVPEAPAPFPIATFNTIPTLVCNSPEPSLPKHPSPPPPANASCSSVRSSVVPPLKQTPEAKTTPEEYHLITPPTVINTDCHERVIVGHHLSPPPSSDSIVMKNIYGFDITEVLAANSSTKDVITKKVDENRFILRSDRQAVAAVLIDAVIERAGTNPSKNALEQLARHLVLKYPNLGDPKRQERGWQMWFHHTIKGLGATGFLEDRLKNQRKRIAKTRSNDATMLLEMPQLDWESADENENPIPDDSKLEYLKHNFGADIPTMMKATVFMRRSLLRVYNREKFAGLQKAIQQMPRLFDTENMIIQDFNVRHPSVSLILYERWPKVARILLDYAEESGVCYKKKLDVAKHRYDLAESDFCLLAYCLLPYVLPSCGRKVAPAFDSDNEDEVALNLSNKRPKQPTGSRKRQSTVKASDLDSLCSMICFKSRNTHVAEILGENKRVAPFILALGSSGILEFVKFFVIIHKLAIPCGPSFMTALDTCFKCFTVLYLPLPIESFDHWLFIQHGVCGKPTKGTELPPVVQALVGQIMCRI